ncbi:MAG: hypothetical protein IKA35_03980 [Bacteroidaceae bacterium]|nr:hypothetical protein [Bacteroidaceae bacterium]MBR4065521.1 hypothetical protein [Bacteroidaceae bacterium]
MKNTYVKPTASAVNMFVENFICDGSRIPVTDDTKPSLTNKQNGAWGDVWNK